MNSLGVWDAARRRIGPALVAAMVGLSATPVWAADGTGGDAGPFRFKIFWALALAGSIAGLVYAWKFFKEMKTADEGSDEMKEIAGHVREERVRLPEAAVQSGRHVLRGDRDLALADGLRLGGAKPLGSVRFPHRRVLLRPGGLLRHEHGHAGQQPDRGRRPQVAQPGPPGGVPLRGGDGPDGRRSGPVGHHPLVPGLALDLPPRPD